MHSGISLRSAVSYPCCSVLGMEGFTGRSIKPATRAAELIDELVVGHRQRARAQAQARCAALMMEFSETRSVCDRQVIADRDAGIAVAHGTCCAGRRSR